MEEAQSMAMRMVEATPAGGDFALDTGAALRPSEGEGR